MTAQRVLVADDNPLDRKILSTIVAKAGYDVIDACDGDDAVEKFYASKPDLVILDALMPGRDGFAVAKEIKSNSGDDFVPIIFLTSLTEANELARCVDAGGDDFLSKPYNRVILQAKLDALERTRELHRTMQSQRDEISLHHVQLLEDQRTAKEVFDKVTHARQVDAHYLRYDLSPLAVFNGDVLLAAQNPAKNLYLMLGDFTGHGLAAAVGAMPLADEFYAMTEKGFPLAEIARACNAKLNRLLPAGYFCCAMMLLLDFARGTIEFWNGGLPSVYLSREGDRSADGVIKLESQHLPMGILQPERFRDATQLVEVSVGDRLFMATDGVVEARDEAGEYFTDTRLEKLLVDASDGDILTTVKDTITEFVGERDDDLTLVELTVVNREEALRTSSAPVKFDHSGPIDWEMSYELGAESLREFNPLPLLQQVLMEAPYLRSRSTEIYTVLAELYSNALEHGVLGLDSGLKASAEGFAEYYAARAKALQDVDGFVRFEIKASLNDDLVDLNITLEDSGAGFAFDQMQESNTGPVGEGQFHGRGYRLLSEICHSVAYRAPGNVVETHMSWRHTS